MAAAAYLEDAGERASLVKVLLGVGGIHRRVIIFDCFIIVHSVALVDPRISSCPQDPREGLLPLDVFAVAA